MGPFFKPGTSLYNTFYGNGGSGTVGIPDTAVQTAGPAVEDFGGYFSAAPSGIDLFNFTDQGPAVQQTPSLPRVIEDAARVVLPQFFQNDQIITGITRSDQMPGRCNIKRRKLKIIVGTDGQPHVIAACPPRRMNPLNARALSRAARRLGSFQRIAGNIEKLVQRACRTGLGRGRRRAPRLPAANCRPRC